MELAAVPDFEQLAAWLDRTPELVQFAGEQRIREARLQLARTQAVADLDWQVGARRLQATDDVALVGSVSMPLGSRGRAQPDIRIAEAELASLEIEREAKGLSLYSTLAEAHGRYRTARVEVQRLQADVIPKLARAEAATERAYRAGAISYLEWAQLQSETTAARRQQLDAALDAQRALIEIQRLTGQPFVAGQVQADEGITP
jgi:cobalt-zinc-cadmium efflux system outer membrane protein